MTDPEDQDLPELELEAVEETAETPATPEAGSEPQPEATAEAAEAVAAAVAEPAPGAEEAAPDASQGQWVWQYAAPPPPPSFGAMFFSGQALPELYRFFACGLLVVIGCLLPWGPVTTEVPGEEEGQVVEELMALPDVIGVETLLGALSLVIGLWLVLSSCYGIYTRRQKILPVFLMLEPAIVSWMRLLDGLDKAGEGADLLATLDAVGTGVVLTLVGSTLVSLQFLFVVGKVYAKKDDKGGASSGRRAAKGGKDKGAKDKKDKGKKDKGGDKDAPDGDKGGKGRGRKKR